MSIQPGNYKLINWQYLDWQKLSHEQSALYRALYYDDETSTLRGSNVYKAVVELMQLLGSQNCKKEDVAALSERVKRECITCFSEHIGNIRYYSHSNPVPECAVSLRVAVRVQAVTKKIMAGESIATALQPYKVREKREGEYHELYADYELFFKAEAEIKDTLVKLYLEKSKTVFAASLKEYCNFLKMIYAHGVHSQKEICSLAFESIKECKKEGMIVSLLDDFLEWKEALFALLVEDKDNLSWLIQKGLLHRVKEKLPEYVIRIEEQENSYLLKVKENAVLTVEIKDNEVLSAARQFWKEMAPEGQEPVAKRVKVDKPLPPEFFCPITGEVMVNPVVTEAGIIYESDAIESWLKNHDTDPLTRKQISKMLIPVFAMKSLIQSFIN